MTAHATGQGTVRTRGPPEAANATAVAIFSDGARFHRLRQFLRRFLGGEMPEFSELVDGFLLNEFETSPVSASYNGRTEYDEKLDDFSATAWMKRDSDAK